MHDLGRVGAEHVAAEDPLAARVDDELHQGAFIAPGQGVLHRLEAGAVDVDLAKLPARLLFGQANGANRRLAEHRRGHIGVVHPDRVVVEQGLGKGAPFGDRDRRQIDPVGHVADRVDIRLAAARPFVDGDGAIADGLDADLGKTEPLGVRVPPGRVHHDIGGELLARRRVDRVPVRLFFDARDLGAAMDLDAAAAHLLPQRNADVVVEAVEQLLAADQFDDLGPEAIEDPGELDRDIAATHNDDAARQLRKIERLVGRNHMVDAGDVRHRGMRSSRTRRR